MDYRAVISSEFYIDNWVDKLDLICEPKTRIGYIGSAFFIGLLIGLSFIPTLSDTYGRRITFSASMVFSLIFQLGLTWSTSLDFSLICLLGMGILWAPRFIVGLSYLDELIPPRFRVDIIFVVFLISTFTTTAVPLIFWLFSKNWQYINVLGLIQTAISILIVPWYVPESPKFYYENN